MFQNVTIYLLFFTPYPKLIGSKWILKMDNFFHKMDRKAL